MRYRTVMNAGWTAVAMLGLGASSTSWCQTASFADVGAEARVRLEESLTELATLREAIAAERVPLGSTMAELEADLSSARQELQSVSRLLDSRSLDLSNLRGEVKARQDEAAYLSNLLGEYIQNFESRLHIGELQRYRDAIESGKLSIERADASPAEVFATRVDVLDVSLGRLEEALGGTKFTGAAVDSEGLVKEGTFVVVGPFAIFRSDDGAVVGTAEQRLSNEPIVVPFASQEDTEAAAALIQRGSGLLPFDATLGNAHKMEATRETLLQHIEKGGPVMVPIIVMAGAALLVALLKWLSLALMRRPSNKSVDALLGAVERQDEEAAQRLGSAVSGRGPLGRMLWTGVQHMKEPRALVEEAMYETVLTAKHRLNSYLPFLAICAASAPLLGLLGTVTGIINTFKLITVFGSGDVKSLSGGISEALITTEFGLIVAIPSLLLHAFLSRKARASVARMEGLAVSFVNRIPSDGRHTVTEARKMPGDPDAVAPDDELVRAQVSRILGELLGPIRESVGHPPRPRVTQRT